MTVIYAFLLGDVISIFEYRLLLDFEFHLFFFATELFRVYNLLLSEHVCGCYFVELVNKFDTNECDTFIIGCFIAFRITLRQFLKIILDFTKSAIFC